MKRILILLVLITASGKLMAQIQGGRNNNNASSALPPPVATREVSGIVKDPKGEAVVGATIKLVAGKDTMRTATSIDGIFIFKNVKEATFVITVTGVGILPDTRKFLNNDAIKNIVLDPIEVKTQDNLLKEVKIDGTPSITYKQDTVEYRASDYKVRPNATVDEVIKKMEGMEVGTDGSLTHQGQAVTRAKLNGKEYAGGSVAQAIQNLPADIVDKIQIVDDYGDLAARTGVRNGEPEKILNITTQADKSIGTTGRVTAQAGNNDRFNAQLFLQRINANQQLGLIGNFRNTINGVAGNSASTGGSGNGGGRGGNGGSPGVTKTGSPSFNYRDQWGKKTQVVGNYSYNFSDNTTNNRSFGERLSVIGTSGFKEERDAANGSRGHRFNFEISHDIDSTNFLQITPSFNYNTTSSSSTSVTDYLNNYTTTGFEHRVENALSSSNGTSKSYGLNAFYLHVFKKPQRNISIQFNINRSENVSNSDRNTNTIRYSDSTTNASSQVSNLRNHILTDRANNSTNYTTTATYVEPLSKLSQLQLVGQVRRSEYDNTAMTDSVRSSDGAIIPVPALNNIYNYNVTETRASLSYRYNGAKFNFSLGAAVVPFSLNGSSMNNTIGQMVGTNRSYTRIIPVARLAYSWSRTERLQITYNGRNNEPNFNQLQPFTDFSNPNNIVIGNPNLKPTFSHTINGSYNNYLANAKLSLSLNATATFFDDQVTSNIYRRAAPGTGGTIQEVNYVNIDGSKNYGTNYSIGKSFADRAYSINLNGSVNYNYANAMSEGIMYNTTTWYLSQRFGPQINPTEWLEINPFYEYSLNRTFSTASNIRSISLETNSFVVTSRMYFLKTFQFNYRLSKSYVSGLANLNTNPFIINAGFEKEFFANRSLVLTFNAFDLLHQNNFVQQTVDQQSGSVTNTLSNNLSRYFLVGIRLNFQKWSGRPQRNGRNMQRRGDGSFIYN